MKKSHTAAVLTLFLWLAFLMPRLFGQDSLYTGRIPPGQRFVENFPLLHYAEIPDLNHENWQLKISGAVKRKLKFDWQSFSRFELIQSVSDFHCVTGWSKLDNHWQGVRIRDLLERAGIKKAARYITFKSADGYVTSLPIGDVLGQDDILATHLESTMLTTELGGPVRAVIPSKYGYKSALWVTEIKLTRRLIKGYYEKQGYSESADPWKEERFDFSKSR